MSEIVLYSSKSGYTEKYAKWIAAELGCECLALKGFGKRSLDEYGTVVYGGTLLAGKIHKLSAFKKLVKGKSKRIALFTCGVTDPARQNPAKLKEGNLGSKQSAIPLFYFSGGLDLQKRGLMGRMLIRFVLKRIKKNPELSEFDRQLLKAPEGPVDLTDREQITPLIAFIKEN